MEQRAHTRRGDDADLDHDGAAIVAVPVGIDVDK
jgi:hypothetical protein